MLQRGRTGDQAERGQMSRPSPLPVPEIPEAKFPRIRPGIDPAQPLGGCLLRTATKQRLRPPYRGPGAGLQMAADYLEMLAEPPHLQRGNLRGGIEEKPQPFSR